MYHIVYVSSATELFTKDELKALVDICNKNNKSLNISGMLLYNEGNFIQLIEGEEETVSKLLHKIEMDSRHRGILILSKGNVDERSFPDWSMGFKIVPAYEFSKFDEFKNSKERLINAKNYPAVTLLKTFSSLSYYRK
ncbi:MAG: hypothetical protein JWN56_1622 [Sphingobacteriales bacterium]|nr:hypothetical protein [Sphingobacteriales bacterium]